MNANGVNANARIVKMNANARLDDNECDHERERNILSMRPSNDFLKRNCVAVHISRLLGSHHQCWSALHPVSHQTSNPHTRENYTAVALSL
jgi:hypothetical protein